jgi:hypothetical protein
MVGPTVSLDSMAKGKLLSLPVDQLAVLATLLCLTSDI